MRALLSVVGCAVAFAACGGSADQPAKPAAKTAATAPSEAAQVPGDAASAAPEDTAAVEQVVTDYTNALIDADGEAACNLMTDDAILGVIDNGKDRSADKAFGDCVDTIEMVGSLMDDSDKAQLKSIEFTGTKIDGDEATVTTAQVDEPLKLLRTEDGWLLNQAPTE